MSDITPWMVEKYKSMRMKDKTSQSEKRTVSSNTINKELILASQVYEKAKEWGKYNGGNPFKGIRLKLKKGKKPGSLSPEDVQALIDAIIHPVKKDLVEFAFNTGWRISEIIGLRWEDVDLESSLAWIVDPKNGNSVEIELNASAKEVISRQAKRSDYVFCHKNGNPFKTNLYGALRQAAKRAGVDLPRMKKWHIFRRTWASMMLQSGCDIETLRELGNWKDYSMPMWYADAGNRQHRREALNRLPKLANGRNMEEILKVPNLTN